MSWVMLSFRMTLNCKSLSRKGARTFCAWMCLVAAILLWSPLWAVALQANGMGCCDGELCAVHPKGHVHSDVAQGQSKPMDCEHGNSDLMKCSMSCCHDPSSSFVAAIVFVAPAPAFVKYSTISLSVDSALQRQKIPRSCDPVYPPPRTSVVSA